MPVPGHLLRAATPFAAFILLGAAMLSPRVACALELARELDPGRMAPARLAGQTGDEGLALRLAPALGATAPEAAAAPSAGEPDAAAGAGPASPWRARLPGLADAAGLLGAGTFLRLALRGADYLLDERAPGPAMADAPGDGGAAARGTEAGPRAGAAAGATTIGDLLRGVDLKLGPLRWRASLTDEYRFQRAADGQRSRGFVTSGNASGSTYLFQPWFAQLRGSLGFVRSTVSSANQGDTNTVSLTGDAGINLFPSSRFPFDASVSVADSRASGEITGSDYRTTRFALRQGYRSLDGTQYSARYERSMISGSGFGDDVLDVVEGTIARRFGVQSVEVTGSHSSNRGGINGTQTDLTRVNGRHSYAPAPNLQVETLATYNQNDIEQSNAGLRSAFSTRFLQVASFGNWRPVEGEPLFDEDHPIVFTGGLRFSGIASDSGSGAVENQSGSASVGVNYTIGPATRLTAAATATQALAASGTPGGLSTSQNVNVSHAPLPKALGDFLYSWNLNGGASNSTGEGGVPASGGAALPSSRQSATGQASHNLSRSFQLAPRASLSLSLGQSAGAAFASGGSGQTLVHNAAAVWSVAGQGASQAYLSLSASDSRSFGATQGGFQLVNLQATRQAPSGPQAFWTANLTVQGARQNLVSTLPGAVPSTGTGGFIFTTTGSVTYQHLRLFNVPRLRLFASYTANQAQLQTRAQGDLAASREVVTGALDTRLDYQIGKTEIRLSFRSANVDHRRNSIFFLRLTRNF